MELDIRKLRILQTIIDDYIATAAPIGSRTISKRSELGLSSATIRNEMSDLEELGYLEQPHASAGRIPSVKAYRLYVNQLMKQATLSTNERLVLAEHARHRVDEANQIVTQTANVLSTMTDYASMVMAPNLQGITLKHIQLVPVTKGRALAVIVTDAGLVHDTLIQIPQSYGMDELERYSRILTSTVANKTLAEALIELQRSLGGELSEKRRFVDELSKALGADNKQSEAFIAIGGATNLLKHKEYSDVDKARGMLSALEAKDNLYSMLSGTNEMEFKITIGTENNIEQMQDSSVITATYKIGGKPVGSFGIIGPTRMNYSKVMAIMSFMGESLTELFSNISNDVDD